MRAFFLVLAVLALAGCASLARHTGDNFEASRADPGRFLTDDQGCRTKGESFISFDLRGMSGSSYARNRAFNRVYDGCMRARGYRLRSYLKNLLPE